MKALEVRKFSFSYTQKQSLLENVSFSLEKGEILCCLGPNGSGKTTMITQILFPNKENRSKIQVFGRSMDSFTLREKSKLIGYVPQRIGSLSLSVFQTVIMGRYPYSKTFTLRLTKEDEEIAYEALRQMGLSHLSDRQLNTLSGGEVQRVFIAQSLAKRAEIYFFDEPMSALDPEYQTSFLEIIDWLSRSGATIIFSTHNPNHMFALKHAKVGLFDHQHRFTLTSADSEECATKIIKIFNESIDIIYNEERNRWFFGFENRRE